MGLVLLRKRVQFCWRGQISGGKTAVLPDGCRFGILHWGRNHWPRVGRLGAAPWDGIGEPLVPRCWEKHRGVAELLQATWLHPAVGFEGKDCAFCLRWLSDPGLVSCRRGCRSCSALIWGWKETLRAPRNAALPTGKLDGRKREGEKEKSVQRLPRCAATLNACFPGASIPRDVPPPLSPHTSPAEQGSLPQITEPLQPRLAAEGRREILQSWGRHSWMLPLLARIRFSGGAEPGSKCISNFRNSSKILKCSQP